MAPIPGEGLVNLCGLPLHRAVFRNEFIIGHPLRNLMENNVRLLLRSSPSEDVTPEMGIALGHALAIEHSKVIVGMDLIKSSPMMKNALISGLISSGADVIDIGIASGPAAAYAARMGDCCVYITEFRQLDLVSGYLLLNKDGGPFGKEQIRHLEQLCMKAPVLSDYKSLGTLKEYYHATNDYNQKLLSLLPTSTGGTIVLNSNCGTATDSAPQILNRMGTDVISINAQKDRDFITKSLSIKEADIHHMRDMVASDAGSIGISINRIGTLMRVFDESSNPLTDDQVMMILMLFLRPAKVVVPMNVSSAIVDIFKGRQKFKVNTPYPEPDLEKMDIILAHPDVGSIHKAMVDSDADLGYYDGGFIFKDISQFADAIHACTILAQFCSNNNLEKIVKSFSRYYTEKKSYKFTCTRSDFVRAVNANLGNVNPKSIYENDGWRIDMESGSFFIEFDRISEDSVTIYAESNDRLYLISLIEVIDSLMVNCVNGQ